MELTTPRVIHVRSPTSMTEASVNESELFGDSIATRFASELDTVDIPAADILNVINTRPSIRLGRHISSRQRTGLGVLRAEASVTTIDGPQSNWASPGHQLSDTLADGRISIDRLASPEAGLDRQAESSSDLQYIAYGERLAGRRATMTLERRIKEQQSTLRRKSTAMDHGVWATFASVTWPKLKSKLQVTLSYRLWKVHMKQVEGNFGTAVASYFILLRWLFLVNMAIFTFWFGFVCIPQFIWETSPGVTIKPHYQSSCVFNSSAAYNCSNGPHSVVYRVEKDCTLVNDTAPVSMCSIHGGVADEEGCTSAVNVTDLRTNCSYEALYVCKDVLPCTPWYQYIVGFITGQGTFNETVLFLGHYTNTTTIRSRSYHMPLVILVMTGVVYVISFVLLVYKMGEAYNESYIEFGANRRINFCNKVFTAWDYNITDSKAAMVKRAHIKTDLEEEVADYDKRSLKRTPSELVFITLLRLFTNSVVIVMLCGAGGVIYLAANWSLTQLSRSESFWIGLVVPSVVSVLNVILPFIFDILARFEKFKTKSGEIKMTLLRSILVRVSSLVVLIITDYILIKCTQPGGTGVQGEADKCTLSDLNILGGVANASGTASTSCRVECWETFIGQDFYKLALTNCVVTIGSTIAFETAMTVVHKLLYHRIKWRYIKPLFTKAVFSIPQSILDLIYTQLLLWLGFLFSPLQPIIILLTLFITFYVKKYSLMWNLEPERRGIFKAARTNFLFLLLLLITLFGALVPVGFAVAKLQPSQSCGPFKGYSTAVAVLTDLIDSIQQCDARLVINFFGSAGFVVPVIIFHLCVIYAMFIILRARNAKFELIKTQLILEGANMAHVSTMVTNLVQQKLTTQRAPPTGTSTVTPIRD